MGQAHGLYKLVSRAPVAPSVRHHGTSPWHPLDSFSVAISFALVPPLVQLLRHLLFFRGVASPALGGAAPAVIDDSHVDATIVVVNGAHDLVHEEGLPRTSPLR